jgi:hypothetical protein
MRRAQLRDTPAHEMNQRIDAGYPEVRVFLQVIGAVEEPRYVRPGSERQAEIEADGFGISLAAPK